MITWNGRKEMVMLCKVLKDLLRPIVFTQSLEHAPTVVQYVQCPQNLYVTYLIGFAVSS